MTGLNSISQLIHDVASSLSGSEISLGLKLAIVIGIPVAIALFNWFRTRIIHEVLTKAANAQDDQDELKDSEEAHKKNAQENAQASLDRSESQKEKDNALKQP